MDYNKIAEAENPAFWATESNRIRLQKEDFSFRGREYLLEPMSSTFRRMCYMKGTQGGGSTVEILKSYHGMIYGRFPTGVLYLFPTADDVYDYSRAIVAPLVSANPYVLGKWIKKVKGVSNSESASLKTVNGANLYMRGAGLTKIIEGEGVSTKLQGIPVDRVVFDEIEQMSRAVIRKAIERMGNSSVKEEIYIGNPGVPGRGIDEIFSGSDVKGKEVRGSDQRHWFRKCLHCGKEPPNGADWFWFTDYSNGWTCAEESFPGCVRQRSDKTGYIRCMKCGKEVFVRDGKWVPKEKENSDYMHGYRWSQLTSPNNDPYEILDAYNNPQGNITDVYRLKLGQAYVDKADRLTIGQVMSRCGQDYMNCSDPGPCSFGLDVGKIKHLVIGKRVGVKTYEIVKVARLSKWDDIAAMVLQFHCKSGVIDEGPYFDEAVRFQDSLRKIKTYLCHYSDPCVPTVYDDKRRRVVVHRTGIFDKTHNLVTEDGLLILPRPSSEISEFAKQVCDPAKSLVINKKTNEGVFRYDGRDDHYRNGLNYFLLAAHNTARAKTHVNRGKQYDTVDNEYARMT